jgi:hypothetical protein
MPSAIHFDKCFIGSKEVQAPKTLTQQNLGHALSPSEWRAMVTGLGLARFGTPLFRQPSTPHHTNFFARRAWSTEKNMQVSMIEWYLVLFELSNLFPGEFCTVHPFVSCHAWPAAKRGSSSALNCRAPPNARAQDCAWKVNTGYTKLADRWV